MIGIEVLSGNTMKMINKSVDNLRDKAV
jgi:hypothetical protein